MNIGLQVLMTGLVFFILSWAFIILFNDISNIIVKGIAVFSWAGGFIAIIAGALMMIWGY